MAACEEIGRNIMQCPICSETLSVPKLLPCLHSFCETCLQTYINESFNTDGITINKEGEDTPIGISCPLCRAFIGKAEEINAKEWAKMLPTNSLLHSLISLKNTEKGPRKCTVCERENESEKEIDNKSASYWCESCNDALCETCERQHRKFKSSNFHKVFSIDDLEAINPSQFTTEMTCEEHTKKYEYYCTDHSLTCCMTCVVLKHRQCEHVVTVDEAAEAKRKSKDEQSLMTYLADLKETYQDLVKNRTQSADELRGKLENTRQIAEKSYDDFICHLTKAKFITLEKISECGEQFLPEIEKEKVDMECKLAGLKDNLEFLQITSKHASPIQYLYTMKKLTEHKNSLETKFDTMETIDIHFTPHDTLSEILKTNDELGSISVFRTKTCDEGNMESREVQHSAQTAAIMVNVKLGDIIDSSTKSADVKPVMVTKSPTNRDNVNQGQVKDKTTTTDVTSATPSFIKKINIKDHITGTAILGDDRILISKSDEKSLTLISRDGKELSSLNLDNDAWGIRMISPTEGAVVVANKCLQFFKVTNNDIVKGESLNIPVMHDFTFYRNHYYIGGNGRIMVYNSLLHHVRDIAVSVTVGYIAVRDDNSLCYTVYGGRELYCITMDGNPVFTYSHDKLQYTTGVTVDNAGYIYVCGGIFNDIHQLTHDGKLHRIIFDNLPGAPYCVSFNTQEGAVAVPGHGLILFNIQNNQIVKITEIKVNVNYDFVYHQGKYYVGCNKKIAVYDSNHHHVRDISVDNNVGYMAVRDDTSLCYTVFGGRELYCITMDGNPVFTYSHDKLQYTTGVTVDNAGYIYVCGGSSSNIHQLTHDGKLQRIIFDNLPAEPYCISFNTGGDKAVIGCCRKLLLYDLK